MPITEGVVTGNNMCAHFIWQTMRKEARQTVMEQPLLSTFLHDSITSHTDFVTAISWFLVDKLDASDIPAVTLREIVNQAVNHSPSIVEQMQRDLLAYKQRDPTCDQYITPFLYFKGYHSLQIYRIAHWLWRQGRRLLANYFQSRLAALFDVDIHPAAILGSGIMLDHATGIVIGETAVIEDDVSILHGVTLGGSGSSVDNRHPKVRHGVLLSTGVKIFGNIEIGAGAKVGAGSLVLMSVPERTTVVGVPARIVGKVKSSMPALDMDHQIDDNNTG